MVVQSLLQWFSRYGVVNTWISDQGAHFKNVVMEQLKSQLHANHHFTLAYCPWSNGTVERLNRDILQVLISLLSEFRKVPREWPQLCPLVQSAINHTPTAALNGLAPITVFTGLPAGNPLDAVFFPHNNNGISKPSSTGVDIVSLTEELRKSMDELHKGVKEKRANLKETAQENQKGKLPNFDIGDYVLVAKTFAGIKGHKLSAKWYGPMQIVGALTPWVYEVKNLLTEVVSKAHITHLKFYHDPTLGVTEELKLQLAHDGVGYEVEKLDGHRKHNGRWELKVVWLAFQPTEATWEPIMQLYKDVAAMVRAYLKGLQCQTHAERRERDNMVSVIKKRFPTFTLGNG